MTPEYKAEKEAHVSQLSGGGIWEINYVTLVAPVRETHFYCKKYVLISVGGRTSVVGIADATRSFQTVYSSVGIDGLHAPLLRHPLCNNRLFLYAAGTKWFAHPTNGGYFTTVFHQKARSYRVVRQT